MVLGTSPLPPSTAPFSTVTMLDDLIEPFTINAPCCTVVGPV
jgi:hypothetical protein